MAGTDLRDSIDRLAEHIRGEGAREAAWHVAMAVSDLLSRVDELENRVASLTLDLTSLARRLDAVERAGS